MKMISRLSKIAAVFLLCLAGSLSYPQGSWEKATIPADQFLRSVIFVDSLYGWISGDSGTILHTTDGGNTWVSQNPGTDNEIYDIFFLNRNLGWASEFNFTTLPYGTVLHKTTDGGAHWTSQPYPEENIFMDCILFTDSLHGWMGGKPHALVRTVDGGLTWTKAHIDTSTLAFFPVIAIKFYNEKYGYASGGIHDVAGVIWRTWDGGDTWQAIDVSYAPADEVFGLHTFDSIHVMGSGGDPDFGYGVGMIRTSDGGVTWSYDEYPIIGNAFDLDFRNSTEAWAPLGLHRKLIYSIDAGINWTATWAPDSTEIYDMIFPDTLHGFAVGKEGAFLRYHPPVIPAVIPVEPGSGGFILCQNYPNPVEAGTTIRFIVPRADAWQTGNVTLPFREIMVKVWDVLGNEVARLGSREILPGSHEVSFSASELPSGCYFYSLLAGSQGCFVTVAGPNRMIITGGR